MEADKRILEVESFGMMKKFSSVESVRDVVEGIFKKVGKEVVFDYKRFQWLFASLMWRVEISDFEYIDNILVVLRKAMDKYFDAWGIKINVEYKEKG